MLSLKEVHKIMREFLKEDSLISQQAKNEIIACKIQHENIINMMPWSVSIKVIAHIEMENLLNQISEPLGGINSVLNKINEKEKYFLLN